MLRNLDRWVRQMRDELARIEVPQQIGDIFGEYRDDPVRFCVEVLGVESATRRTTGERYQFTALQALVSEPRVAVRSGHGIGKSAIDAWAATWWLLTRPLSRVVVLAPEYSRQIRAILFSEIRKWVRRSKVPLPLTVFASRVLVAGYGEEWSATGMSAAGDVDRLEGFHAEGGVLVICDEMKGIPQDAFDSVQGALTGAEDSRLLVTSVPGGAGSGPFWKACVKHADRWKVHHIPSTDSILVSVEWYEDRARDWGVGSPLYQARVLGEFADAGEGVLFPLTLLEGAIGHELEGDEDAGVFFGVDVARSIAGDFNCIAATRGGRLLDLELWRSADTMEVVEKVAHAAVARGVKRAAVDVGGPGAGVVDRLRQLKYEVEQVHFGGGASDPQRFRNRRAEMYWTLREKLERGEVSLPDDQELVADLSALRYAFTQDGRIQLESKDEVRKRLGRSPDRADAVALALAEYAEPWFPMIARAGPSEDACGVPMDGRWQPWHPGMRDL
ncbi:MAG: hypothetical protein JSW71_05110 [Gemmatimonadota bacterium]|nr:MAG: hypothetical protein JSW71_05110 [Gemmatimonadota bacterium]